MFPSGVEDAAIGQEARRYAMRANMDAAKAIELARHLTALPPGLRSLGTLWPVCQGPNKWQGILSQRHCPQCCLYLCHLVGSLGFYPRGCAVLGMAPSASRAKEA